MHRWVERPTSWPVTGTHWTSVPRTRRAEPQGMRLQFGRVDVIGSTGGGRGRDGDGGQTCKVKMSCVEEGRSW